MVIKINFDKYKYIETYDYDGYDIPIYQHKESQRYIAIVEECWKLGHDKLDRLKYKIEYFITKTFNPEDLDCWDDYS